MAVFFLHALDYEFWDEAVDGAAETKNFFDQTRADEGVLGVGHEEDGFDVGRKAAVHEGHLELVFVVADGADAADYGVGTLFAGEVDEQAFEGGDGDVGEFRDAFREHGDALFHGEEGIFLGIAEDGDDEVIEDFGGPGNEVQVSVG